MRINSSVPLFPVGKVVATPGAIALGVDLVPYIRRHHHGDWGDLEPCDRQANEDALVDGDRLLSKYDTAGGAVYVITEWDRSVTTVMLAREY